MDKIVSIVSIIKDWTTEELVNAWNHRCDKENNMDERVEDMAFFDEMFQSLSPTEIIDKVRGCDFRTGDDYFAFNRCGNLESFTYIEDYSCFDFYALAEYLAEYGDSLTRDVDTDILLDDFICGYFDNYDFHQIKCVIETYMENNTFDLLTDDWDDFNKDIISHIEENGLGDYEEDEVSEEEVEEFIKSLLEKDDDDEDDDVEGYSNEEDED